MSFLQNKNDGNNNQNGEGNWRDNLPALFQHSKICWGASSGCLRPGCSEMASTFPHMENCRDPNCNELSCRAANTIHRQLWGNYINSFK